MCKRRRIHFFLDMRGNLHCLFGGAAAGSVGHADKVSAHFTNSIRYLKHVVKSVFLFRGKDLTGKSDFLLSQELFDFHKPKFIPFQAQFSSQYF